MLQFCKKNIFITVFLSFCSLYTTCTGNTNIQQSSNAQSGVVTFYRAGAYKDNVGNSIACYWVNNERIDLTTADFSKDAGAYHVVAENGQIYTAGKYKDNDGKYIYCYWINGEKTDLLIPEFSSRVNAYGLFIKDDQVYMAGYYIDSDNNQIPCYWINEKRIDLTSPKSSKAIATNILVHESKIYVGGYYNYGDHIAIEPCYWVDGERTDLGGLGSVKSIIVENGIIYAFGHYRISRYYFGMACYWINGERKILPIPSSATSSGINSVYRYNEEIYIIGEYGSGVRDTACYWVNEKRTDLTTFGERTYASSIFINADKTYVVGRHRGKSYYWVNGKGKKLSTPSTYETRRSRASSITILNSNVYIFGALWDEYTTHYCYWVNGQRTDFITNSGEYISAWTFTIQE
jgi:hypothetical protein